MRTRTPQDKSFIVGALKGVRWAQFVLILFQIGEAIFVGVESIFAWLRGIAS